jgi:glycolate dehydrogenase FAD-binding subunit
MLSPTQTETAWNEIAGIVGPENLRPAETHDEISGVQPRMVVEPGTAEEVASVLRCASGAGISAIPRGGGTKLNWGNQPHRADLLLSTRRLDRVVEYAHSDLTATVEAGCTVEKFQQTLAMHGQQLALDPLWPARATIGGMLATNDSGSLRVRYGALRDQIIGITIALADGKLAKSGGKVVKNVAGYDLQKLMTGSFGTLGVITQAIFRLYPCPKDTRNFSFSFNDAEAANKFLLRILDSQIACTGMQTRCGRGAKIEVDVRLEGIREALDVQSEGLPRLAGEGTFAVADAQVWDAREALFLDGEASAVLKIGMLPTQLAWSCNFIQRVCAMLAVQWQYVAQGTGIGLLKLSAERTNAEEPLLRALINIRAQFEAQEGSAVVLTSPASMKSKIDAWGTAPDSLPLMRRIKEQFDPAGMLNPGRFVGGI